MRFGHRHWKSRLGDTVCPSVAESPSCPDEYRTNSLKFACFQPVDPANRPPRSPIHPSSVNRTETRTRDPPVLSLQWHRIQFWYGTSARSSRGGGEISRSYKGARIFARLGKSRVLPTSKKMAFSFCGIRRL